MRFAAALLLLFASLTQAVAAETMLLAHPWPKEAVYAPRVMPLICADAFRQIGLDAEVRAFQEYGQIQLARLRNRHSNLHNAGPVQDTVVYICLHKRHAPP